jgi:hypothetical protein
LRRVRLWNHALLLPWTVQVCLAGSVSECLLLLLPPPPPLPLRHPHLLGRFLVISRLAQW